MLHLYSDMEVIYFTLHWFGYIAPDYRKTFCFGRTEAVEEVIEIEAIQQINHLIDINIEMRFSFYFNHLCIFRSIQFIATSKHKPHVSKPQNGVGIIHIVWRLFMKSRLFSNQN